MDGNQKMTHEELLNCFQEHLQRRQLSQKTIKAYKNDIELLLRTEINGKHKFKLVIVNYQKRIIESELSYNTKKRKLVSIQIFVDFLVQESLLSPDAVKKMKYKI